METASPGRGATRVPAPRCGGYRYSAHGASVRFRNLGRARRTSLLPMRKGLPRMNLLCGRSWVARNDSNLEGHSPPGFVRLTNGFVECLENPWDLRGLDPEPA